MSGFCLLATVDWEVFGKKKHFHRLLSMMKIKAAKYSLL